MLLVYSYFEKGCRIKCTRQPRKVLWMVLSALFLRWLDTVFQLPDYQFLTLKNSPKT